MDPRNYKFILVSDPAEFDKARVLFREYAELIKVDLCFQNFMNELKEIHVQYHQPTGGLILIIDNLTGEPVGCVGIRKLDNHVAELKRMYVREKYRRMGLGRQLLDRAIMLAVTLKYKKIRLDTLGFMKPAIKLYRANGFR